MDTTDRINRFYKKVKIVLFMKLVMTAQRKSDAISSKEQNLGIKKREEGWICPRQNHTVCIGLKISWMIWKKKKKKFKDLYPSVQSAEMLQVHWEGSYWSESWSRKHTCRRW